MQEERISDNRKMGRFSDIQFDGQSYFNNYSLDRKASFIEVMQLEGSEIFQQKDIFDLMVFQEKRRSMMRSSNNSYVQKLQSQMQEEECGGNLRYSSRNEVYHTCQCIGQCIYSHCACSEKISQNCIPGVCCSSCVIAKESHGKSIWHCQCCVTKNSPIDKCICIKNEQECRALFCKYRKFLDDKKKKIKKKQLKKNHDQENFRVCLCKKSHCLKKYCECFASGSKCNDQCRCQGCHNQDQYEQSEQEQKNQERYGRVQDESEEQDMVDQYLQERDYTNQMLPKEMQFTEINFQYAKQR